MLGMMKEEHWKYWEDIKTMLRFVDTVIVPYFDQVHEKLPLCKCTQPGLCIFDVFTAHLSEELKAN